MTPTKCFTGPSGRARNIRYLDQDQLGRLFAAAKDRPLRDRLALAFAYKLALRSSELCGLRTADVDRKNGKVYVQGLKGGSEAIYRLPEDLRKILKGYRAAGTYLFGSRQSEQLSRVQYWRIVKETAKAAGLPSWVTAHTLRHSAAVHGLDAGRDVVDMQDLLRHSNPQSTAIYARISNKRREAYMKALDESPFIVKVR